MNAGVSTDVTAVEHSPLTRSSSPPVFAWPGWRHLRRTLWYSALTAALFAVVFGGADALARQHSYRVDLAIPADGSIPFVPAATLIYSSLYAMFWLVPFVLRTEHQIKALAQVVAWEIMIAAPFFLALPMPERAVPADLGRYANAFRLADWINLQYNQFPSLHATFALTVGAVLAWRSAGPVRLAIAAWTLAIVGSTLLTWQHIIVDVAGAFVLTAAVLSRSSVMTRGTLNEVQS